MLYLIEALTMVLMTLLEKLLYCYLLCVYGPLYVVFVVLLRLKILVFKCKLWLGRRQEACLSPLSPRSEVFDVGETSTEEEVDFLTHRSLPYIVRITLWTAKEVAKFLLRRQKVKLISDEKLIFVMLNTVYAQNLRWDKNHDAFVFSLEDLKKFTLFEGFFWEASKVLFDPESRKIEIQLTDNQRVSSDCSASERADYDLAKLHLQVCLTFYAPGMSHNYVHFVYPSAVCVYSKQLLDRRKVLYKLLAPHFRFMERLNYQALRVSHASSNNRSLFSRLICHWKPFPITREQFTGQMEQKLKRFYVDLGARDFPSKEDYAENRLSDEKSCKENSNRRTHWLFPPLYTTEKSQQKIPYISYLTQYYQVVDAFVRDVEPFVDRQEWSELSHAIARHVPRFEHVSLVDAVTTFIHMVSVEHSADHVSYNKYFAREHGCFSIRSPFRRFSDADAWKDLIGPFRSVESVKQDVTSLVKPIDVMRARCFLNVFVDYIPSPTCDLSLLGTKYGFDHPSLKAAQRGFKSRLRALDGNLKNENSSFLVCDSGNGSEKRCAGLQIVAVGDLIRSNCY